MTNSSSKMSYKFWSSTWWDSKLTTIVLKGILGKPSMGRKKHIIVSYALLIIQEYLIVRIQHEGYK